MNYNLIIELGMPRSGSTLQYLLAHELLGSKAFLLQRPASGPLFPKHREPIPIFKEHRMRPEFLKELMRGKAIILYTWRDLRDIAVSEHHYPEKWYERVAIAARSWYAVHDMKVLFPERVLMQPYLLLLDHFQDFAKELAQFLGTDADLPALEAEWSLPMIRQNNPNLTPEQIWERFGPQGSHISANFGESTWREQLAREDLERVYSEHGQWFMDALGEDVKKNEKKGLDAVDSGL